MVALGVFAALAAGGAVLMVRALRELDAALDSLGP